MNTDYSNPNNWLNIPASDMPVDIFYLYPTAWQRRAGEQNVCPICHAGMRKGAETVFNVQASVFFPVGNVYAPFYRQADGAFMLDKTEAERRAVLRAAPVMDAVAAFEYFIGNYNQGRPYILAAHSQGSDVMKEILFDFMTEHREVYKNMIAAYLIGCGITQSELDLHPHLKFASCADDTGVILSYNTEAPDATTPNAIVPEGSLVINPLSWTRGEAPAAASFNNGSLLTGRGKLDVQKHFADATINKRRGTVVCSTASVSEFGNPAPLPTFHFCDYAFYYQNLRENAVIRTKRFMENR